MYVMDIKIVMITVTRLQKDAQVSGIAKIKYFKYQM